MADNVDLVPLLDGDVVDGVHAGGLIEDGEFEVDLALLISHFACQRMTTIHLESQVL